MSSFGSRPPSAKASLPDKPLPSPERRPDAGSRMRRSLTAQRREASFARWPGGATLGGRRVDGNADAGGIPDKCDRQGRSVGPTAFRPRFLPEIIVLFQCGCVLAPAEAKTNVFASREGRHLRGSDFPCDPIADSPVCPLVNRN